MAASGEGSGGADGWMDSPVPSEGTEHGLCGSSDPPAETDTRPTGAETSGRDEAGWSCAGHSPRIASMAFIPTTLALESEVWEICIIRPG